MPGTELISKELYRDVKKMSRTELVALLKKTRSAGKADAIKETGAADIDLVKIRSELTGIKGLGEERVSRIIEILENNLS